MKIHRSNPESGFSIIPNEALRDPRLSYAARGVLAELLSRPDDWTTSADEIWKRARRERGSAGEGRGVMRAVFAELAACGYLRRVRRHAAGGQMITDLHIYDVPAGDTDDGTGGRRSYQGKHASSQVAPTTGSPTVGPPVVGPPVVGPPVVITKTEDEDGSKKIDNEDGGSLSRARHGLEAAGATEREIDFIVSSTTDNPRIGAPAAYLAAAITKGDAASLIAQAREERPIGPPPTRQDKTDAIFTRAAERARARDQAERAREWCGRCDERTRQLGDPPARCPDCHPLTALDAMGGGHPQGQIIQGAVIT